MIALVIVLISISILYYSKNATRRMSEQLYRKICSTKQQKHYVLYNQLGIALALIIYPHIKVYRKSSLKMLKQMNKAYSEQYDFWIVSQQCFIMFFSLFLASIVSKWDSSVLIIILGSLLCWVKQYQIKHHYTQYNTQMTVTLPTILLETILLLNAGQTLQQAWEKIAFSHNGALYDDMQFIMLRCKNGSSFVEQLVQFSKYTQQPTLRKFMTICLQMTQKGGNQAVQLLNSMLIEAWEKQKNMLLKKAQATNQNLLLPGSLIFLGIIIMIIGPVFISGFL